MQQDLVEKLAVTIELCGGTTLSAAALIVITEELDQYEPERLSRALDRCRREVKGHLAPSDIIRRIEQDDGRPGAEEAWAMIPKSEADSACWTAEMSGAYGVCHDMILDGDMVAARMAFKDSYDRRCRDARSRGEAVYWSTTLGHNRPHRETVLREAVEKGRISAGYAENLLGYQIDAPSLPEPVNSKPLKLSDGGHSVGDPDAVSAMLREAGLVE